MHAKTNKDRLLRGIRCLQLLQRTNVPNSPLAKAVAKALVPLLEVMPTLPAEDVLTPMPEPGAPSGS